MSSEGTSGDAAATQLESIRGLLAAATARLLGDTIAVADEDWRGPSRLPGWTRGHVATHVARQADAIGRLLEGTVTGTPGRTYADREQREAEISAGADRSGLDLQIDLDTAAGRFAERMDEVDTAGTWSTEVELSNGSRLPARLLPLLRLTEVVLHHVDADIGYEVDDIDPDAAGWMLEWAALRLRSVDDCPAVDLVVDGGPTVSVGDGDRVPVRGTAPLLLGWLTGRSGADRVTGAESITLPAF